MLLPVTTRFSTRMRLLEYFNDYLPQTILKPFVLKSNWTPPHHRALHLRPWRTRTHCCGHIVAHDVSWAAQTGKHLLRTQNVSEQNQKQFLCPGHKICVRNKCCTRGQTGKHLCRSQCVRNNVSTTIMCPRFPGP